MATISKIKINDESYSIQGQGYSISDNKGWQEGSDSGNQATGEYSHAEGVCTTTNIRGSHAEGTFNYQESKGIHMVGIGTSEGDRLNAHTITSEGLHYLYGIGSYVGNNMSSSEDLASVLNNILIRLSALDGYTVNSVVQTYLNEGYKLLTILYFNPYATQATWTVGSESVVIPQSVHGLENSDSFGKAIRIVPVNCSTYTEVYSNTIGSVSNNTLVMGSRDQNWAAYGSVSSTSEETGYLVVLIED